MDQIRKSILDINQERINAISSNFVFEEVEDEIQKGVIDDLSYSDDMKFYKTGKEIKEKLGLLKTKLESELVENGKQRSELLDSIGELPNEDYYIYGDFRETMGEVPKQFGYKGVSESPAIFTTLLDSNTVKSTWEDKSKYNSLVGRYVCLKQDIKKIELIESNLDDKAKIKLNLRNLSALGF